VLSREGDGRIRVRQLAAALGVTTGSFYWHFEDRADFLEQILAWWVRHYTGELAALVPTLPGTPREKLDAIARQVVRSGAARYDVAVRAWAAHEAGAAEAVREADAIRMRAVGSLFRALGFRGRECDVRTKAFVTFGSLHTAVGEQQSDRARVAQFLRLVEILCREAPG
jgi:AcrR family transcriptional regulator